MGITVEKCLQAWTNSLRQMNAKADIVFFGDSQTYFGDFASVFPEKVVCNLGLRGDTIQGMIDRMEQVRLLEPKFVYLMAGINDVAMCDLDGFRQKYETLILLLLKQISKARIIVQSILPVNDALFKISCNNKQIVSCNLVIASLSYDYDLRYVDLYSLYVKEGLLPKEMTADGIHLQKDAYNMWYKVLKDL